MSIGKAETEAPSEDTRQRLMNAGERLFGERGIHGVTLKEINAAAGQRNESALHYHFGSRSGLVQAILEHRISVIDVRRSTLLDEIERSDTAPTLHALVSAILQPLFEMASDDNGAFHVRFIAQTLCSPASADSKGFDSELTPSQERAVHMLAKKSGHSEEVLSFRLRVALTSVIMVLSETRPRVDPLSDNAAWKRFEHDLLASQIGLLTAPNDI